MEKFSRPSIDTQLDALGLKSEGMRSDFSNHLWNGFKEALSRDKDMQAKYAQAHSLKDEGAKMEMETAWMKSGPLAGMTPATAGNVLESLNDSVQLSKNKKEARLLLQSAFSHEASVDHFQWEHGKNTQAVKAWLSQKNEDGTTVAAKLRDALGIEVSKPADVKMDDLVKAVWLKTAELHGEKSPDPGKASISELVTLASNCKTKEPLLFKSVVASIQADNAPGVKQAIDLTAKRNMDKMKMAA